MNSHMGSITTHGYIPLVNPHMESILCPALDERTHAGEVVLPDRQAFLLPEEHVPGVYVRQEAWFEQVLAPSNKTKHSRPALDGGARK